MVSPAQRLARIERGHYRKSDIDWILAVARAAVAWREHPGVAEVLALKDAVEGSDE